jgi:hypothetical protein
MRFPVAVLIILVPTMASGDYFTGNDLHSFCTNNRGVVSGYVAGWMGKREDDADVMTKALAPVKGRERRMLIAVGDTLLKACIPQSATLDQLVDVLCKTLRNVPEERHIDATKLMSVSMFISFPCQPK